MEILRPAITLIEESLVEGVAVLVVERQLRNPGLSGLKERIDGLVGSGCLDILIDLARVADMDSSDIGRLIRAHHAARHAGGVVHLCNVAPRIADLMRMTRLSTVFHIHTDISQAIAAIKQSGPTA